MLYATPFITVYCCVLAAVLGLCMGSFLNCLAWRIVHGESALKGRSHCDVCGHVLGPRDLVPVVSYLASKGRCRYCGARLSARHLLAELATGITYVLVLLKYDISLQALQWVLYGSVLLLCAFADLEGYIIPDGALILGALVRVAYLAVTRAPGRAWADALLGGFAIGGGLYLGLVGNLLCLFAACLLGIVFGLIATRGENETPFPWGPSICAAGILAALYGEGLVAAYLGLF